ncbi:hypothetical protein THAOC_05455, partial [Thalassiosira oceanica]
MVSAAPLPDASIRARRHACADDGSDKGKGGQGLRSKAAQPRADSRVGQRGGPPPSR